MKLESVSAIVQALNEARVRYLVVGGLAVVAHGYLRFTNDVDMVIQLKPENVLRAFKALEGIGFRPAVPVTAQQFADPGTRDRWIREKGMRVLQFWSDEHRETSVDVFVLEPFDFDGEYESALRKQLLDRFEVRVVDIPTLIAMKEEAGRPEDMVDIKYLRMRMEDREEN